jgi:Polyketide cyclase / dehydrase and lipid transport
MASIHRETVVGVASEHAWAALRTVGAAHELFAPVLTDGELNGETRRVTFANGMVVNERIVDVDDGRRRLAYSVLDAPGLRYHHASMQVLEEGPNRCRFVWITDFLPADASATLTPLIEAGSTALKTNLEAGKPMTAATQLA